MSGVQSVPWQDASELAMTGQWFYPKKDWPHSADSNDFNTEDMRGEAVHRVNMWTFKTHQVPAAVTATADLTDCILNYEDMKNSVDHANSYRRVQFFFAFAFLRFVNSFADRDVSKASSAALTAVSDEDTETEKVPKSLGESSMYAHAASVGMPTRFVDLRHVVSHGELPDLQLLKRAAEEALEWLWNRWWKFHAIGDPAIAVRRVVALRQQYMIAAGSLQA